MIRLKYTYWLLFNFGLLSCTNADNTITQSNMPVVTTPEETTDPTPAYADIDFSHWKITLPVDNDNNGSPDEYQPSSLVNYGYQSITQLKEFLFDDASDTSLVFYTYPGGSTTVNSSYPRTELREQLTPGNNYDNWTLTQGGTLYGKLKVAEISEDHETSREYHRVIVMQIHGIISQEDVVTYNLDANHAPPLLKMIWDEGYIKAYKKTLVNENTTGADLYDDSSSTWADVNYNFGYVGKNTFTITIEVTLGSIAITANNQTHTFQDISLQKWPFENYFKAGAYLTATTEDAFARIKYYELTVSH